MIWLKIAQMALSNDLSLECLICHFCIALAKYWAIQSQYTHISFYLLNFFLSYCSHLETVKANTKINALELVRNFWEDHLLFQSLQRDARDNKLLYELANMFKTHSLSITKLTALSISHFTWSNMFLTSWSPNRPWKRNLTSLTTRWKNKNIETAFEITERTVWRCQMSNNQKP